MRLNFSQMNSTPASAKGLIYAGITALFWGVLAIALKFTVQTVDPLTVVWFRFSFSFITLFVWMLFSDRREIRIITHPPVAVIIAAVFLGLNYYGFIAGVKYTSPSNAQVFIQFGAVGFALSGVLIYKEKVIWKHIAGIIMVTVGITIFYLEQIAMIKGTGSEYTHGILLISGGGISWAVFASIQKGMVSKLNPNQFNLIVFGFCTLMFLPFINLDPLYSLTLIEWLVLIFLGLNTVLAYGFLSLAIKYSEAIKVSVIISLNPILTFAGMALLAYLEVNWIEPEHFSGLSILGAALVISGAVVTILSRRNKNIFPD